MQSSEELVTIPLSRLKELEALEAKKIEKLNKLRKYQLENTKEYNQKVLDRYHKNKEAINEKRRAAYKAKKEAEEAAKAAEAAQP